jgi:hypothetical protein
MRFFGCDFCSLNFVKINSVVYDNGTYFISMILIKMREKDIIAK